LTTNHLSRSGRSGLSVTHRLHAALMMARTSASIKRGSAHESRSDTPFPIARHVDRTDVDLRRGSS